MKIPEHDKYAIDAIAAGLTGGAIMDWLPELTALVTLIWVLIRVWETKTVRCLFRKLRSKQ